MRSILCNTPEAGLFSLGACPLTSSSRSGVAFSSGWVTLTNASKLTDSTLIQLSTSPFQPSPGKFQLNLTSPSVNQQYIVAMELNYTRGGSTFHGFSNALTFWYEKSTSGDGLKDWEKNHGWGVTTEDAMGNYHTRPAVPSINAYATNGLTNDLLEKEFGLDPTTIDTASSHMLDAWNMTFDLGVDSSNPAVPSQFQAWNEAPGFNYSRACAYPGEPSGECSQRFTSSIASEPSNLSDNSWWASRVLWSAAALATLETLMARENVGWLRAVSGTTIITGSSGLVSERTLTVWGKLSWGANPLAQSTILGGGSDGSRLSPLSSVHLQLYAVYSRLGATPCSNNAPPSGGANGWAVQLELNDTNSLSSVEIANYTTPTSITSSSQCGGVTSYTVTVPVDNTVQFQHLDLRIVVNKSGTLTPLHISGSSTTATLSLDMFSQGATGSTTCSASGQTEMVLQSNDGNSVCLQWKPVSAGGKAPTWLFVPTLNGTLSANPWGLKRYVGEQSFDLLVVNNPTGQPITSMNVPTQWGSYYSVTLQTGLNNFLVPRTQFLYSSLGQGIVLGSNLTDRNLTVTPPILGTNELNAISLGGASPLQNISCYWQNLAINDNSAHTAICSAESGTTKGTSDAVRMIGDAGT